MLDFIIRDARVLDGSGAPMSRADVGIEEGRISRIGDLAGVEARGTIDADDACLAPGFIDMHTHSDFFLPKFPRDAGDRNRTDRGRCARSGLPWFCSSPP